MSRVLEIEGHVGHYGDGTGAVSVVDEVKEVRKIAKEVHRILKEGGAKQSLFEDTKSKTQRANINTIVAHHNKDTDGLVVSYHLNATSPITTRPIGCEVLYTTQKTLAINLSAAMAKAGGFVNRGAKYRNNLGVLTGTKEPAIIIEVFFVNSHKDVELYRKNFNAICYAIAETLANYTNQPLKKKVVEAKPAKTVDTMIEFTGVDEKLAKAWRIQSGAFATKALAEAAAKKANFPYHEIHQGEDGKWRIQSGKYTDLDTCLEHVDKSCLPYVTIYRYTE